MTDVRLQRRIVVVVATTRAAAASLRPVDGQVHAAVGRGIQLLDEMAEEISRDGGPEAQKQLAQARRELESLLDAGSGSRPS